MREARYCVARMTADRLEILGEFANRADAVDMADRAKYMAPIVLLADEYGPREVFTATTGSLKLPVGIVSVKEN